MRLFLALIPLTVGSGFVLAEPAVDIRLLKTDPTTAGFVRNALDEVRFTATEFEDRIDEMVKGRKVAELARFRQAAITHGERIDFKKDSDEVEIADGEMLPVGITLEIEPTFGSEKLVDLRLAFSSQRSVGKNRIEMDHTISSAMLRADAWEIIATWGDASESMILMAYFSGHDAKGVNFDITESLREITIYGELILCDANDLKTFGRATPATRAKAVEWLRERGELVATSGLRSLSRRRVHQKDALDWIHDTNGWISTPLGLEIELQGQIGPFGELVELDVTASWSPRDLPKPPQTPFAEFRHSETTPAGSTLVIEAKTRPEKGKVPVLFLTPQVRTFREGSAKATLQIKAKPGDITSAWYYVHPSFLRKLNEFGGANANPEPGVGSPPLKTLLEAAGMLFPAGTQATFIPSDCQVLLYHDSKGHAQFQAIVNHHGSAIQDRKTE